MQDIRSWLEGIGLGQYADAFEFHAVEPWFLSALTAEDLREVGVAKVGHRRRILLAASGEEIHEAPEHSHHAIQEPMPQVEALVERRQLTVLFCDMVGSTQLSQQLDPEDLREVVRAYQDAVSGSITRYQGHIAKFLGDGVLAYFGWPQAREDQAQRAVRAAMDAVRAVDELQFGSGLKIEARAGIATGTVVIGDLVGDTAMDAEAIIGETPNLAARLQGEAQPGEVVIGPTTRRLIAKVFQLDDMGGQSLKGFDEAVHAWRVVGEVPSETRFDSTSRGSLNNLFGRQAECQLLIDRWSAVRSGEGQVIYLSGEAGIGKSRLLQAIRDHVGQDSAFELGFQCSPYHSGSAFFPVVQRFERAMGFTTEDDTEGRLQKLSSHWSDVHPDPKASFWYIANLLNLPVETKPELKNLTPQQIRDRTIGSINTHIHHLSKNHPVLLLFEDAHWIDPSTETLLGELVQKCQSDGILAIITHRPEYSPPWPRHPHVTAIELNRLGREQGLEIVRGIAGTDIPEGVANDIVTKADGIPLYIEEIAKAAVEARATDTNDSIEALIPTTLQASLNERLDRLGEAKSIAQTAAVIGREFTHGLLSDVSAAPDLGSKIERLVGSELVYRVRSEPDPAYIFKHALVQNAAYDSLLKADRRAVHARVADILETRHPDIAVQQPEIIAHHCSEAGLSGKAIDYWERAGRGGVARSAHAEAIKSFRAALALLSNEQDCLANRERELSIFAALGSSLMASKGYASEEVGEAYKHAFELSKSMDDKAEVFSAISGLWNYYSVIGDFDTAIGLGDQLLEAAVAKEDALAHAAACRALGTSYHRIGKPHVAREHCECGITLYDYEKHANLAATYGTDVLANILFNLSWCLWEIGEPNNAKHVMDQAKAQAERVQHPFTTTWYYVYASILHKFRQEPRATLELSKLGLRNAHEQQLAQLKGVGGVLHGWARSMLGDNDGIQELRDGIDGWSSTGAQQMIPQWRCFLAESLLKIGDAEAGLIEIDHALENIERTGQKSYEAEAYRLKGELLLARSSCDEDAAKKAFESAITLAKEQEASSYILRAAVSLGRFFVKRGLPERAEKIVSPEYATFTEGFDTVDLVAARKLLEDCGRHVDNQSNDC